MADLYFDDDHPYTPPRPVPTSRDVRVGGWLAVLCIFLLVLQPVSWLLWLRELWPIDKESLKTWTLLTMGTLSLKTLVGIAVGALLAMKVPSAARVARIYFACATVLPLASYALFTAVSGSPREMIWHPAAFVIPAAWYLYLMLSKRVRETYQP